MLNSPFSLVTLSNCAPVALFLATTLAPGITPPELSTTVPASAEFATPCAYAGVENSTAVTAASRHTSTTRDKRLIASIPPWSLPNHSLEPLILKGAHARVKSSGFGSTRSDLLEAITDKVCERKNGRAAEATRPFDVDNRYPISDIRYPIARLPDYPIPRFPDSCYQLKRVTSWM